MNKEELDAAVLRRRQDFIDGCPKPCRGKISDLQTRMAQAIERLDQAKNQAAALHHMSEYSRLDGKSQGVALALSYVDEIVRETRDV